MNFLRLPPVAVLVTLVCATPAAAASKYAYFVFREGNGVTRVFNLNMDPVYDRLTHLRRGNDFKETLNCHYRDHSGALHSFDAIPEEICGNGGPIKFFLGMNLGTRTDSATRLVEHKFIDFSSEQEIREKDAEGKVTRKFISAHVMSATQYFARDARRDAGTALYPVEGAPVVPEAGQMSCGIHYSIQAQCM